MLIKVSVIVLRCGQGLIKKWSGLMCGIVGLFLKDISLEANLGNLLSEMLISMSDRGPDSAGIAIYAEKETGRSKFTIQSENAKTDF